MNPAVNWVCKQEWYFRCERAQLNGRCANIDAADARQTKGKRIPIAPTVSKVLEDIVATRFWMLNMLLLTAPGRAAVVPATQRKWHT